MEKNKIPTSGTYTLLDIAKDESLGYLSYYVITNTVSTVKKYKDTGNIVILTDHPAEANSEYVGDNEYGDEYASQYPGSYLYTDLYVGDEHVAGGYGFDSPCTRNEILKLPQKVKELEDDIKKYHEASEDSSSDNISNTVSNKSIQVDPIYNLVDTGEKQFRLSLDESDQTLSFLVSHKPIIRSAILTYEVTSAITGETYYYDQSPEVEYKEVTKSKKYSYITFDYEGNDDLYGFYMTYSFDLKGYTINVNSDYDNDFMGSFDEPIQFDFNGGSHEDLIIVKDPSYHPDVVQRRIRIYFNTSMQQKFYNNAKYEGIIRYRLHLLTSASVRTKISKDICRLGFTFPCFYKIGKNDSWEFINSSSPDWKSFILVPGYEDVQVTFDHEGSEEDYETLLVPQVILKEYLRLRDITCCLEHSNIKFEWTDAGGGKLLGLNGDQQINYYKLLSPQKYKGQVIWKFSIL